MSLTLKSQSKELRQEQEQTESSLSQREARKASIVEAALYVTGRPMDLRTLCSVAKLASESKAKELAQAIARKHSATGSALEVLELQDGRFVMQLKSQFVPYVKNLATRKLLTIGPLRTLSFIAAKQPVTQSHVVRVRGKLAYKHVKQLQDLQLISRSSIGKTRLLRTTDLFSDFFNLSRDPRLMKRQLTHLFSVLESQREGEPGKRPVQ